MERGHPARFLQAGSLRSIFLLPLRIYDTTKTAKAAALIGTTIRRSPTICNTGILLKITITATA